MAIDYEQLATLGIDDALLDSVRALVARLDDCIDWPEFGRIPGRRLHTNGLHAAIETLLPRRRYSFLERSAIQDRLIAGLAKRRNPGAALTFRLLCSSECVPASEVQSLLGPGGLDELVGRGILIRDGADVACAVRFVPYGDDFYLTDSLLLGDNKIEHGVQPTYLSFETHAQITHIKRMLAGRKLHRSLEVGCGTGLVTLELAGTVERREGADLHARSLAFARINQALRNDQDARFYESDLLSAAAGPFDLIIFNPFKPTLESLGFIFSFLEQSFERLSERGIVLLVLHAQMKNDADPVFDAIAAALGQKWQRAVRRTLLSSSLDAERSVHSISMLWITPDSIGDGAPPVSYALNGAYLSWLGRRAYASARERRFSA